MLKPKCKMNVASRTVQQWRSFYWFFDQFVTPRLIILHEDYYVNTGTRVYMIHLFNKTIHDTPHFRFRLRHCCIDEHFAFFKAVCSKRISFCLVISNL